MRNLPVIRLHMPFADFAVSFPPLQERRVRVAVDKNSPPIADVSQRRKCRFNYVGVRGSAGSSFDKLRMSYFGLSSC